MTQQTLTILKGTQASIKNGIETFKSNMLYDAGEIHLDAKKEDIAATIFYLKMRDKKWSRYPLMFSEKEYFYSLTHLPAEPYDRSVRVSTILDTYRSLDRVILAILINREVGEFTVTWPKAVSVDNYRNIIDNFIESAGEVWTDTNYIKQSPKFICDPKIWFYGRAPIRE